MIVNLAFIRRHQTLAIIGLAVIMLAVTSCWIGNSPAKGVAPAIKDRAADERSAGRSVKIQINSPIDISFPKFPREFACVVSLLNDSMVNPRAYVDKGEIHIFFDLDYEKWPWTTSPFPGNGAQVMSGRSLLIRYFDESGQHLGHFQTREKYIAGWALKEKVLLPEVENGKYVWHAWDDAQKRPVPLTYPHGLLPKDNHLVYQINRRDADYIRHIEVGFYTPEYRRDYLTLSSLRFGCTAFLHRHK